MEECSPGYLTGNIMVNKCVVKECSPGYLEILWLINVLWNNVLMVI